MGGASLYGEKDFVQWDSAMTEKDPAAIELFNKQALIGGERVPIIFNHFAKDHNLQESVGGEVWHGDVYANIAFLPETTGDDQALSVPLAARYQNCAASARDLCQPYKYDAYCWFPRSDTIPPKEQSRRFPSQASWHPGNRYHQYESRKTAMTILQGFKVALTTWKSGIEKDGFPLKESYWHVGDIYKTAQDTFKSYMAGEGKGKSQCEKKFESVGLAKVCRIPMNGISEFLPVNLGTENSIHAYMKEASNGWVPKEGAKEVYSGVDLLPLSWKIPESEVDLHAIAIATTYKKPIVDKQWYDIGDDDVEEDAEHSRRLRSTKITKEDEVQLTRVSLRRNLNGDEVSPGLGWGIEGSSTGYCDGSSNSFNCHREAGTDCLLSGHNDSRNVISGDGLSGWFVVKLPKVKEGLIFARLQVSY